MAKKIKMNYKVVDMSKPRPSSGASLGTLDMGALRKQVEKETKYVYSAKSRADSIRYANEIFRRIAGKDIPPSVLRKGPNELLAWAKKNIPKVKGTKESVTFNNPRKNLRHDGFSLIGEIYDQIKKGKDLLDRVDSQLGTLREIIKHC